jgi:hypothetical protein
VDYNQGNSLFIRLRNLQDILAKACQIVLDDNLKHSYCLSIGVLFSLAIAEAFVLY